MDKILRINMGADGGPKMTEGPVGGYAGLGGRALTSMIVGTEVPPRAIRWGRRTSWSSHRAC